MSSEVARVPVKKRQRQKLEEDTAAFLAKGGEVQKLAIRVPEKSDKCGYCNKQLVQVNTRGAPVMRTFCGQACAKAAKNDMTLAEVKNRQSLREYKRREKQNRR